MAHAATDTERYVEAVAPLAAEQALKDALVNPTTETLLTTIEQNAGGQQTLDAPAAGAKLAPAIVAVISSGEASDAAAPAAVSPPGAAATSA